MAEVAVEDSAAAAVDAEAASEVAEEDEEGSTRDLLRE